MRPAPITYALAQASSGQPPASVWGINAKGQHLALIAALAAENEAKKNIFPAPLTRHTGNYAETAQRAQQAGNFPGLPDIAEMTGAGMAETGGMNRRQGIDIGFLKAADHYRPLGLRSFSCRLFFPGHGNYPLNSPGSLA